MITIAIRETSERYDEPLNRCPVRIESAGDGAGAYVGTVTGDVVVTNALHVEFVEIADAWTWVATKGYRRPADGAYND